MKNSLIILLLFPFIFLTSSCKIVRSLKQSSKDSTVVHSDKQGSARTDSSGTKTDKTYTKETIYYPRDTTVNNFHFPAMPAPIVRIIETGHEQTEQAQVIKDTSWKEAFNSLAVLIANKETESKTRVGPSVLEWILIAGIGILLLKNFAPGIISSFTRK